MEKTSADNGGSKPNKIIRLGKKEIELTPMLIRYMAKFVVRLAIFITAFVMYLLHKEVFIAFFTHSYKVGPVPFGVSLLNILWAIFMIMMIRHLFPNDLVTMALKKHNPTYYVEQPKYNPAKLLDFVKDINARAWTVLLIWLSTNAIAAALYLLDILDSADLLMLTVFYFLCDYICILFFCPFQEFVMHNKCCVNCRIFEWGHFMMFTPMLFIRNFFSWSLFFTSVVVLIKWEITYAKHPERFWLGSNKSLQCKNCKDKTCQLKYNTKHTKPLKNN